MSPAASTPPAGTPTLAVTGLSKLFGGLRAVSECSFEIAPATIVGLIGPNGSGKTTVFNLITNLLRPDAGAVYFHGARIDGLKTYEIARRGIGRKIGRASCRERVENTMGEGCCKIKDR